MTIMNSYNQKRKNHSGIVSIKNEQGLGDPVDGENLRIGLNWMYSVAEIIDAG
jgi:hypothetical protein